jgi:hypothetical protein
MHAPAPNGGRVGAGGASSKTRNEALKCDDTLTYYGMFSSHHVFTKNSGPGKRQNGQSGTLTIIFLEYTW